MGQIKTLYKKLVTYFAFNFYCQYICPNHYKTKDVNINCIMPEKGCKLFDIAWEYYMDLEYREGKW